MMDSKFIHILRESTVIYKKLGIKSVSMEDLCKELKISKKTIYKYVSNKEELIANIFLDYLELEFETQINELLEKNTNAIDFIFSITNYYHYENNAISIAMIHDLYTFFPSIYSQFESNGQKRKQETLLQNIIKGKQEGLYKESIQAELFTIIFSSINPFATNTIELPYTEKEILQEAIRIFIYAIGTEKGISYYESLLALHD